MEESSGSLINRNMSKTKDYTSLLRSTNKGIITYRGSSVECFREDSSTREESFDEFSWPPKSYTCSFCNREFRSAQALGGHMNVHRREKAKLKQITPQRYPPFLHPQYQFLDLNLDQNPNPNPNPKPNITTCFSSQTSSFPTIFTPFTYSCRSLPLSDPYRFHRLCLSNSARLEAFRSRKPDFMVDFSHEREGVIDKKSDTGLAVEPKFENLDLELRLGCLK
ncbi:hypothetical protein R6Q59_021703 [Mikania micrantha]|uniref:C2H2-type domain-containing protein n=1 Tax=Mikania micrantha TaxID=192012 RepID=A0A5N6MW79_9ASTR|nr:hypothetical protein E3N88_26745 [Mikania micrantha]